MRGGKRKYIENITHKMTPKKLSPRGFSKNKGVDCTPWAARQMPRSVAGKSGIKMTAKKNLVAFKRKFCTNFRFTCFAIHSGTFG